MIKDCTKENKENKIYGMWGVKDKMEREQVVNR